MGCLMKKKQNSILMKKQMCFWLTVTLWVPAPFAVTPMHMEISAKDAAAHYHLSNSSIHTVH